MPRLTPDEAFEADVKNIGVEDRNPKLIGHSMIDSLGVAVQTIVYEHDTSQGITTRYAVYYGDNRHAAVSAIVETPDQRKTRFGDIN